jgi:hypothetical protein
VAIPLDGPPPLPGGGGAGPAGPTPADKGAQPQPGAPNPGSSQVGGAAVRLGMEIDQSLKLLAQALPTLAPWVQRVVMDLRTNLGQALASGAVPTSPAPAADNAAFPTGTGRL